MLTELEDVEISAPEGWIGSMLAGAGDCVRRNPVIANVLRYTELHVAN
jgi:predicted HTH transcriptional regulator